MFAEGSGCSMWKNITCPNNSLHEDIPYIRRGSRPGPEGRASQGLHTAYTVDNSGITRLVVGVRMYLQ